MKTKILWLLIASGTVNGQTITRSFKQDLDKIHFIKIDLPGRITVSNTNINWMIFDYQVSTSGKIIGWSNKGDSLIYKPSLKLVGDTLCITSHKNVWMVGFSSYREDVSQFIYLPNSVTLILNADSELSINGTYRNIMAYNSNSTILNAERDQMGKLICHATDGQIKINGQTRKNEFDFQGSGNAEYVIHSKNIFVNLK